MEKVHLWTRQNEKILDILEKEGVYYAKKKYIVQKNDTLANYYIELYDWFVRHGQKIVAKPEKAEYPIWCSISEEYMLRGVPGDVLLELNVDRERVLYFDSTRWDLVLNHTYVPKNEADEDRFVKSAQSRGITNNFSFLSDYYKRFYPDIVREVVQSWDRIFEIDLEKANKFSIQANIWQIRSEDIQSIVKYEQEENQA